VSADGLDALIRDVADFPKPGVMFKDITPLLADPEAFSAVVAALAAAGRDPCGNVVVDKVVGIEARGFILAAPVALSLGVGFAPARKAGKLPGQVYRGTYTSEYGEATVELHQDAVLPGERVLLIDDVLATGGTMAATVALVAQCGGTVTRAAVLLELAFLHGRDQVDVPLAALRTT
jgi:adenine phosphoribosyltransferase